MDFDVIKLNVLNIIALSMQMMQVERVVAIAVGLTALTYNVMKIYSWLKKNNKI
jgi:hypothetical protein